MLIFSHVLIALVSMIYAAYSFYKPSMLKIRIVYGLSAFTLSSGIVLILTTNSPMLNACLSGVLYLGFITVTLIATHRKLAQ